MGARPHVVNQSNSDVARARERESEGAWGQDYQGSLHSSHLAQRNICTQRKASCSLKATQGAAGAAGSPEEWVAEAGRKFRLTITQQRESEQNQPNAAPVLHESSGKGRLVFMGWYPRRSLLYGFASRGQVQRSDPLLERLLFEVVRALDARVMECLKQYLCSGWLGMRRSCIRLTRRNNRKQSR